MNHLEPTISASATRVAVFDRALAPADGISGSAKRPPDPKTAFTVARAVDA